MWCERWHMLVFDSYSDWTNPLLVDAGDRHYSLLFSTLAPHSSLRLPPHPSLTRSTAAVLQNESRDKCRSVSVSMDTRGLLQRLPQSLFTDAIVLGDNGSQTYAPPSSSLHYTLLDSLGSADRCSLKHALIHKTHSIFICRDLCLKHLHIFMGEKQVLLMLQG